MDDIIYTLTCMQALQILVSHSDGIRHFELAIYLHCILSSLYPCDSADKTIPLTLTNGVKVSHKKLHTKSTSYIC